LKSHLQKNTYFNLKKSSQNMPHDPQHPLNVSHAYANKYLHQKNREKRSYVSLRLLGVSDTDPAVRAARDFLHQNGGALTAPSWAKFWYLFLVALSRIVWGN